MDLPNGFNDVAAQFWLSCFPTCANPVLGLTCRLRIWHSTNGTLFTTHKGYESGDASSPVHTSLIWGTVAKGRSQFVPRFTYPALAGCVYARELSFAKSCILAHLESKAEGHRQNLKFRADQSAIQLNDCNSNQAMF
jgi:hypothetical protein